MIARPFVHLAVALACSAALLPSPARAQTPAPPPTAPTADPHAGHQAPVDPHAGHQMPTPPPSEQAPLPPFIPPLTDADRQAAFPEVDGHSVHDDVVNYFVLFDQLEWQSGDDPGFGWDTRGWVGRDRDRLWFRTEGQHADGRTNDAQTHVFYGRSIARWWDVVGGLRQDFRPGPAQTWAAIGVQGLAPYRFDVEATAYVGAAWRTHFRLETEYELLLTNRLVLQPLAEMEIYGKDDPEHERGAGLSTLDLGIRVRYEFRREFAPYVGMMWNQKFFGTADIAEASGEKAGHTRLVVGLRLWL